MLGQKTSVLLCPIGQRATELWKKLGFAASLPGKPAYLGRLQTAMCRLHVPSLMLMAHRILYSTTNISHSWASMNDRLPPSPHHGTRGIHLTYSLLETQNFRPHPRPAESESEFGQDSLLILCMLKYVTQWFTKLNQLWRKGHWKKNISL